MEAEISSSAHGPVTTHRVTEVCSAVVSYTGYILL